MNLRDCILRPGTVKQVLENGEIKAVVPGLFNINDIEKAPPIYPFFGNQSNSYSYPNEGEEVWVLNVLGNNRQLYWFRKDDYKENNKELLQEENVEVLCNKEFGGGLWASIYFSDGSGWVINRDDSRIQIKSDGSILLDSGFPGRLIDINSQSISLGSPGKSKHTAAYGDVVTDTMEIIYNMFNMIKEASKISPQTQGISVAIESQINQLNSIIPKIASQNVTLE